MSRPADPFRHGALAVAAGALGLAVVLAVPAGASTDPAPRTESWAAELAIEGGDDRDVVLDAGAIRLAGTDVRSGELVLAPRRTAGVVDTVRGVAAADVPAGSSVVVEARGLRGDGGWGAWVTVPREGGARLGGPSTEISVRVLLRREGAGTGPVLRGLWLTTTAVPPTTATRTETRTETRTRTRTETATVTAPTSTSTTSARPTTTTTAQPTTTTTQPTTPTTPTTATTTPRPTTTTTTEPTTTEPTTTTTARPEPTTTTPAPTTTTPTTTTPPTSEPDTTEPTTTTTSTTTPTTTTTTPVVPPAALVPGVPLPTADLPPARPLPAAAPTSSWWGADLLAWLGRAF
ncbi:hypothetical protein [Actinomycetospora lemnae]|uniref:Uncharacterized protein n=1 Tax=Actinomycetospora lemnae TaxID=3019891 RepID=A0ABT5T1C6_9PSEU|nr:hypothetical protein [Actinomycetospora sp. DW7H6]MDD7968809.1 hypothetical protein [Actinomycetospora sp. DW7H6]